MPKAFSVVWYFTNHFSSNPHLVRFTNFQTEIEIGSDVNRSFECHPSRRKSLLLLLRGEAISTKSVVFDLVPNEANFNKY